MFNLIPDVDGSRDFARSFAVKSNDMLAAVYVGALARAVIALHDLVLNKIEYREAEKRLDSAEQGKKEEKKPVEKKEEKEKEKEKEKKKKEEERK